MKLEEDVRKLARSFYSQKLYSSSKDCNGISLFLNKNNFSGIQVLFLYWIDIYSVFYQELQNKEWEYLTEEVIKDDIRLDAFMHWRKLNIESKISLNKEQINNPNTRSIRHKGMGKPQDFPIFKGPKVKNNG